MTISKAPASDHRRGSPAVSTWRGRSELFELSLDLLATLDRGGCFTDVNPAAEGILGYTPKELIGVRAVDLLHPDDYDGTLALSPDEPSGGHGQPATPGPDGDPVVLEYENRMRRKDGSYCWLQWNARMLEDTWYAVARDVTERRQLEQRAVRDHLTGLPNRIGLSERLRGALARMDRHEGLVAVLFVDLDHFKLVNDGQGHETGDCFLRAAAARLLDAVRTADSVARFGGDEFVILLQDVLLPADAVAIAQRVVDSLQEPLVVDASKLQIGASVGVAVTSSASVSAELLLQEADIAMYRAKARGGSCVELFDESVRAEVRQRVVDERALRVAVEQDELRLYFQPIVALPESTVSQCEALLRWEHPTRGVLRPRDFLALAEETGLIVSLGEWVLRAACQEAARWRREHHHVPVTVNVSTRQLDQPDFTHTVAGILRESELPPAGLCLEITETAIMDHVSRVAPQLRDLRRLGVRIAMDDFGSGYSSLGYLRTLPLDIIKIDKSFVHGVLTDSQDRAIVAGMFDLGRQTDRAVIAEGVETEELHAELVGLGCTLAQGYLYDRPKPASELSLDGYSSRIRPGIGDPLAIREFMRQIGIPARIR